MSCSIPANPDISGIGVRIAIYIQNFLSFIPAFWALMDKEVTSKELKTVEKQSTTILITAFAVLISAVVQIKTLGLSSFHTTIVLNLSWMNNTNTFIYFLLYIHHKSHPNRGEERVQPQWSAWCTHIMRAVCPSLESRNSILSVEGKRRGSFSDEAPPSHMKGYIVSWAHVIRSRVVLVLGSLHLTLMAALGLWLWISPIAFEKHQPKLITTSGDGLPIQCTTTTLIGHDVVLTSKTLQKVSLVIYSCFVIPGLNLLVPVISFLFIHIGSGGIVGHASRIDHSTKAVLAGLVFLLAINIVFMFDIETTLYRAHERNQQAQGESDWTFGQTLALFLLVLPIRDMIEYIKQMWEAERARRCTKQLVDAVERGDAQAALHAARYAANVSVGIPGKFPSALQFAAYIGACELVKVLLARGAYIDVEGGEHGTPLVAATSQSQEGIIHLLLSCGANVHLADSTGMQALHYAAKHGQLVVVTALLDRGAVVNASANDGSSALHLAAHHGYDDIIKVLLKHHADVLKLDGSGNLALHYAVIHGCPSSVQHLCGKHRITISKSVPHDAVMSTLGWQVGHHKYLNCPDRDGWTPMCRAAALGHEEIIRVFLYCNHIVQNPRGASPFDAEHDHLRGLPESLRTPWTTACHEYINKAGTKKRSPLSHAAENGHASIVKLLLNFEKWSGAVREKDEDGYTPLFYAAKAGHDLIAGMLIRHGADTQAVDKYNRTPLIHAVMQDHESIVRLLLQDSTQGTTQVAQNGRVPLSYAAARGRDSMIALLLECGVDVNQANNNGRTPLSYAVGGSHESTVRLLLHHGADIHRADKHGWSPLIKAANVGHKGVTRLLLDWGANSDHTTAKGHTALHHAVMARNKTIAQMLIQRSSISLDQRDDDGRTPLSWVADRSQYVMEMAMKLEQSGKNRDVSPAASTTAEPGQDSRESIAEMLLVFGADVDQGDDQGLTPLHHAIIADYLPVIQQLVKSGADIHRVTRSGHTALGLAAIHGSKSAVSHLLERGAEVNPRIEPEDGGSPLIYAAEKNDNAATHILLEHGAHVDHADNQGITALIRAVRNGFIPIAWDLLEYGADPSITDKDGKTALIWAAMSGQETAVRTLLDHNSDINQSDMMEYTPLFYAVLESHPHIVRLLLEHGAAYDRPSCEGVLPIHLALYKENDVITNLLMMAGAQFSDEEFKLRTRQDGEEKR